MSEENVEMVRRIYEAFNRGDIGAMVEDLDPDFECVAMGVIPGTEGVYRSPEQRWYALARRSPRTPENQAQTRSPRLRRRQRPPYRAYGNTACRA